MFGQDAAPQGQGVTPDFRPEYADTGYQKPKQDEPELLMGSTRHKSALLPGNLEGIFRLATIFFKSGLIPKDYDSVERTFVAMVMGMDLNLTPSQSVQNIAVINGRPSVWGDMLIALVLQSGLLVELPEDRYEGEFPNDDFKCVVSVKRKGEPRPIVREFSVEDAKKAKLWTKEKTPWITYPKRMLFMRARSWALRDAFSDVLRGLRIAEEEKDGGQFTDLINDMVEATPAQAVEDENEVLEGLTRELLEGAGLTALPPGFNGFVHLSAENLGMTALELLTKVSRNERETGRFWETYRKWKDQYMSQAGNGGETEEKFSARDQHDRVTELCEKLGRNRTDVLREYSGQGTLKKLKYDEAQNIITDLEAELLLKDQAGDLKKDKRETFPMSETSEAGEEEKETAALRRELGSKGKALGKNIDAECQERFGVPLYKLERDQAIKWIKALDVQLSRVNEENPLKQPEKPASAKQAREEAKSAFIAVCTEAGAHPMKFLEYLFPTKADSELTAEDWQVARSAAFLPDDYHQYAMNFSEDGMYRGAKVAWQWGVRDVESAVAFTAEMRGAGKLDEMLAGVT